MRIEYGIFEDWEQIFEIELSVYKSRAFSPTIIQHFLMSRSVIAAFNDYGKIIGFLIFDLVEEDPENSPYARILNIAVDPVYQGNGIGKKLIDDFEEGVLQHHYFKAYLEVDVHNEGAIRLYKKLGYTPCVQVPDFFGPGTMAISMYKVLE